MQENMRKGLELAREMAETAAMTAEDARSAIPVRTPDTKCMCSSRVASIVLLCILVPGGTVLWPNLLLFLKNLYCNVLFMYKEQLVSRDRRVGSCRDRGGVPAQAFRAAEAPQLRDNLTFYDRARNVPVDSTRNYSSGYLS